MPLDLKHKRSYIIEKHKQESWFHILPVLGKRLFEKNLHQEQGKFKKKKKKKNKKKHMRFAKPKFQLETPGQGVLKYGAYLNTFSWSNNRKVTSKQHYINKIVEEMKNIPQIWICILQSIDICWERPDQTFKQFSFLSGSDI